ncbi:hypothetical protein HN858_02025 [Candidatus Falkowbacteria bacterium]|jgi:hypothetical protein|nr:hypothetical protein [Candidatus Falkowbacteria bacterium]MBT5503588.1 hypothetical protein [Candidatus Falkowbacteria bacterium]MBT6573988.1 hypothetical protein [Candidatus Falkowbacteria bacterium]MBT7348433.1 hypothetical protein [Candidatus Falkowbacteria bacterium]MBT7500613.1 hypothetical protein [Candidatus Falkowbacteria bacterium]
MEKPFDTFIKIFIVVVVTSGLIIYGWNLMHGRNLAKAPQIDLSAYEDGGFYVETWKNDNAEVGEYLSSLIEQEAERLKKEKAAEAIQVEQLQFEIVTGYIYFKDSLGLSNKEQTDKLIKTFLEDFPELKDLSIENFQNNKIISDEVTYIARVKYSDLENIDEVLEKLKVEYSDVVLVK